MIKNLIRHEYVIRSEVLTNISNHIDNLNGNNIIYHTNRNKFMTDLNNCILKLNTSYNDVIHKHKKIEYNIDSTMDYIDYYNYLNFFNQGIDENNENNEIKIKLKFFTEDTNNVDEDILSLM